MPRAASDPIEPGARAAQRLLDSERLSLPGLADQIHQRMATMSRFTRVVFSPRGESNILVGTLTPEERSAVLGFASEYLGKTVPLRLTAAPHHRMSVVLSRAFPALSNPHIRPTAGLVVSSLAAILVSSGCEVAITPGVNPLRQTFMLCIRSLPASHVGPNEKFT